MVYVSHQLQLSACVQEKRNIFDQLVRLERFIRDGLLNQSDSKCFFALTGGMTQGVSMELCWQDLPKIGPLVDTPIF